jgi:hypothetical protein
MVNAISTTSKPIAGAAIWEHRAVDYRRHIHDLRTHSYEGAYSREEREQVFCLAFDLMTPVAERVLSDLKAFFLAGQGWIRTVRPSSTEEGGLVGFWELAWPLQQQSKNRFNQKPLEPLAIHAVFPLKSTLGMEWTHPHLAMLRPCCHSGLAAAWPLQVTSEEDAWRQEPILRVLAEAELHERTFLADSNWKLLSSLYEAE